MSLANSASDTPQPNQPPQEPSASRTGPAATAATSDREREMDHKKNEDGGASATPSSAAAAAATSASASGGATAGAAASSSASPSSMAFLADVAAGVAQSLTPPTSAAALRAALLAAGALGVALFVLGAVRSHPAFLTQPGELSDGQLMALLVIAAVSLAFAGVHVLALHDYFFAAPGGRARGAVPLPAHEPVATATGAGSASPAAAAAVAASGYSASVGRVLSEESYSALFAAFELSVCMVLFFVCDRTKLLERAKKRYDRDQFWFLCLLLLLVGLGTLHKAARPKVRPPAAKPATGTDDTAAAAGAGGGVGASASGAEATAASASAANATVVTVPPAAPAPASLSTAPSNDDDAASPFFHVPHLQRDQTEEWKGWMQVMFLWYHYFNAKEIYNVIRLYIAAYVWMTGFGNFSYYYVRRDFSLLRFLHMQWRLNFLVFWVCLVMQNEYMLYYICMLHTTFTVVIYAGLGIYSHVNQTFAGACAKFAALTALAVVVWDVPGVFQFAWAPLEPLVQFTNPYRPTQPALFEWQFRSHLDHLVWIFGMLCAFNHPTWDGWLRRLDALPAATGAVIKALVVAACLAALAVYYQNVFSLGKREYNAWHPYTSWVPIAVFIVLRNISQVARQYHIHLFEWLGKITLETYISQYHIWMATTGVNGSPKRLLLFLPKQYPLLNFVLASALCLFVSHRMFHATNALKSFVLPSSLTPAQLQRVAATCAVVLGGLYGAAMLVNAVTRGQGAGSAAASPPMDGGDALVATATAAAGDAAATVVATVSAALAGSAGDAAP
jgi:hypothetical protein